MIYILQIPIIKNSNKKEKIKIMLKNNSNV